MTRETKTIQSEGVPVIEGFMGVVLEDFAILDGVSLPGCKVGAITHRTPEGNWATTSLEHHRPEMSA